MLYQSLCFLTIGCNQGNTYLKMLQKEKQDYFSKQYYGIDVSHYQGDIAWDVVSKYPWQSRALNLVFMKATEGGTFVCPKFQENWHRIQAYPQISIKGAYHFYRPNKLGVVQADNFSTQLNQAGFDPAQDYYIIDIETPPSAEQKEAFLPQIRNFYDCMRDQGFEKSMIYTTQSFWNQHIGEGGVDLWKNYALWLARRGKNDGNIPSGTKWYTERPIGAPLPIVWQFTSKGTIGGIVGDVDMNLVSKVLID